MFIECFPFMAFGSPSCHNYPELVDMLLVTIKLDQRWSALSNSGNGSISMYVQYSIDVIMILVLQIWRPTRALNILNLLGGR